MKSLDEVAQKLWEELLDEQYTNGDEAMLTTLKNALKDIRKEALSKAVSVIYFADTSDYEPALWDIVKLLGGEEATDLLESDERAAFQKYCQGAV